MSTPPVHSKGRQMTQSSTPNVTEPAESTMARTTPGTATTGPWQVRPDNTGQWLIVHNDKAQVVCILKAHQTEDAQRIAATPEMLAFIRQVVLFSNDASLAQTAAVICRDVTGSEPELAP